MKRPFGKFKTRSIVFAIAGIAASMVVVSWQTRRPGDQVLSLLLGHDTVYAPSFTERGFHRLEAGMSTDEVEDMMGGPPLEKTEYPSGKVIWAYSVSPRDTNHWKNNVSIEDGRVVSTYSGYYMD